MRSEDERDPLSGSSEAVGSVAIKWGAIVVIVLAVLYFLARYLIPLFWQAPPRY